MRNAPRQSRREVRGSMLRAICVGGPARLVLAPIVAVALAATLVSCAPPAAARPHEIALTAAQTWVKNDSLLPKSITGAPPTTSTASSLSSSLARGASKAGSPGLLSLTTLLRDSGMEVLDPQDHGKVVAAQLDPTSGMRVDAGEVLLLHDQLVKRTSTTFHGILKALQTDLGMKPNFKEAHLLKALEQDLATDAASSNPERRVFAGVMYAANGSGPKLRASTAHSTDALNGLQAFYIIESITNDGAVDRYQVTGGSGSASTSSSSISTSDGPITLAAETSRPCESSDEIKNIILDGVKSGIAKVSATLSEKMNEGVAEWLESQHSTWTERALKLGTALKILDAVVPILNLLAMSALLNAKLEQSPDPLVRTKSQEEGGETSRIRATLSYDLPDHSMSSNCLSVLFAVFGKEATFPFKGPVKDTRVTWNMVSSSPMYQNGAYDFGIADFCSAACGDQPGASYLGRTNESGETSTSLIGLKQRIRVSDIVQMKTVGLKLSINPDDVKDQYKQALSTMLKAVGAAVDVGLGNIAGVGTGLIASEMVSLGVLSAYTSASVKDWLPRWPKAIQVHMSESPTSAGHYDLTTTAKIIQNCDQRTFCVYSGVGNEVTGTYTLDHSDTDCPAVIHFPPISSTSYLGVVLSQGEKSDHFQLEGAIKSPICDAPSTIPEDPSQTPSLLEADYPVNGTSVSFVHSFEGLSYTVTATFLY